jgi:hypothetical protein
MTNYIYKIKIKSIKEPKILKGDRGTAFKQRHDNLRDDEKGVKCAIGDEWTGTWGDIAWIEREAVNTPNLTEKKVDNSKKMTFQEFKAKYPEKAKLWEK